MSERKEKHIDILDIRTSRHEAYEQGTHIETYDMDEKGNLVRTQSKKKHWWD